MKQNKSKSNHADRGIVKAGAVQTTENTNLLVKIGKVRNIHKMT